MRIATPNIDRLERIITALGSNVSVSVQPRDIAVEPNLWTVSIRIGDDYVHGQGNTLAQAIDEADRLRIAKTAKSSLPNLEKQAA